MLPPLRHGTWLLPGVLGVLGGCGRAPPVDVAPGAVATASAAPAPSASAPAPATAWREGVRAFEDARAAGAPALVYVSSTWCPPCRALEANVLSRPELLEGASGLSLVKLSGDEEGAQALVERLEARHYPTLVVLDAAGEEVFRADHAVSTDELLPALAAATATGGGQRAARERLRRGQATGADCALLAARDWAPPHGAPEAAGAEALEELARAFDACGDPRARARLAGHLLALAADRGAAGPRARAPALLDAMLASPETLHASRLWLTTYAGVIAPWAQPPASPGFAALRARWLDGVRALRARPGLPVDVWTRTHQAALDLARAEHPRQALPEALRADLIEAAREALRRASTPSERHATVGAAAFLLRAAGRKDEARAALEAEAARSDDPGHDLVTLSAWALEDGDRAGAKRWARQAVERALGRPSRLQWAAHELAVLAKGPDRAELLRRGDEALALLLEKDDALLGRNRVRARELADALRSLGRDASVRALAAKHRPRCASVRSETRAACEALLDGL